MEAAQGDANVGWELANDARRERGRRFGNVPLNSVGRRSRGFAGRKHADESDFRTRVRGATRKVRWFPRRLG